jgi:hypothetical protein
LACVANDTPGVGTIVQVPSGVEALDVSVRFTARILLCVAGEVPTRLMVERPRLALLDGSSKLPGATNATESAVPEFVSLNGLPVKLRPVTERNPLHAGVVSESVKPVPISGTFVASRRTSIDTVPPG